MNDEIKDDFDQVINRFTIDITHQFNRTSWQFNVKHNGVLIGRGQDYTTGIMARRAADTFISQYVVQEQKP